MSLAARHPVIPDGIRRNISSNTFHAACQHECVADVFDKDSLHCEPLSLCRR